MEKNCRGRGYYLGQTNTRAFRNVPETIERLPRQMRGVPQKAFGLELRFGAQPDRFRGIA